MTIKRNTGGRTPIDSLRARLEATDGSGHSSTSSLRARLEAHSVSELKTARNRDADQTAPEKALLHFPHHYRRVMWGLEEARLLAKCRIEYVDSDMRRIDFAWPEKKVGLRVTSWPRAAGGHRDIPDFIYNVAALRERNWLIFYVDPYSPAFTDQLDRVISAIKRVGAPKKAGR
jgi:hypothetical protein